MEKDKKFGITGSDLKYIAILAMLIDHVAHIFVPSDWLLYSCMRFIGRLTAPIMCFFISEGYHYTRNLKKYYIRMAVFAVISHFAFSFCFYDSFFLFRKSSVITTLLLSLLSVDILNRKEFDNAYKLPAIMFIAIIAEKCDWGYEAVIYTLVFAIARGNRKKQLISYFLVACIFKVIPFITTVSKDFSYFPDKWRSLGVLLPIPLLMLYNGERGGGKHTKWVFYVFYPAHLLLLGYLKMKYL